ncbi:unnamed protein product [Ceratitis capitata]|uniref:(Mediterranean fruit fly) hypothetical protein n=1 Tax=Ceratitis capitata TaxID=7213 RepID=A0A811UP06_CERCA|nr:unnamed protein product [Ceratitis capitata]
MLASNAKTSKDKCITENNKKKKEEVTAQSQSLHTAHENAPSTSSAACNCPSELSGSLIMSNSVATQYSNSSFYDSTLLTPPDLPSDVEDEVLLAYNPNEPRYCICNQISYGSMIACDNKKCPYEWFHFHGRCKETSKG